MARSLSLPAAWLAAGFLLLLTLPTSAAQVPTRPEESAVDFAIVCGQSFALVPYNGRSVIRCEVKDLTDDSATPPVAGQGPVFPVQSHTTTFKINGTVPVNVTGWQLIMGTNPAITRGRESLPIEFTIQSTPAIASASVSFIVDAKYEVPNAQPITRTFRLDAHVERYDFALVETVNTNQKAGQFDLVKYKVHVANAAVFPDSYRFDVKAPSGFLVSVPPSLYVPALSEGNATYYVQTPHGKIYELGQSVLFEFRTVSLTGTGAYSTVGILNVRGAYIPSYWIPLTLVGLIAAVIVTRGSRERAQMRRLESGRPRRVQPTPRQVVLLADLKRTDPAAYKERKEKLEAIYVARKARYKDERKAQLARDAEERRQAKLEFAAAKKGRKDEKLAAKRQRKLDREAAAAQAKVDKKDAKVQGKELKVKEKELGRRRKVLEKARAKQAKIDAKQAKVDAKAAAVAAKAQAKADRQAAKQAKAAARAAKKNGPPPGGQ